MPPERRGRPGVDHAEVVMRKFVREFPDAVLLGGWATFIRTGVAKSHDIDVIVDHATLDRLGAKYELSASRHIGGQKFEVKLEGVAVDVYPVYQSKLGRRLKVPVEVLLNQSEKVDGVRVLKAEAQFVAKMAGLLDRPDSLPGEKDRLEMWSLLNTGAELDFKLVARLLSEAGWQPEQQAELLGAAFDLLEETPDLTKRNRAALRALRAGAVGVVHSIERPSKETER
jgi:hypothetical protein